MGDYDTYFLIEEEALEKTGVLARYREWDFEDGLYDLMDDEIRKEQKKIEKEMDSVIKTN